MAVLSRFGVFERCLYDKTCSVILRLSATELSVAKTFVSAHREDLIAVKKFSGFRRIATRRYEKLLKKRGRHEA